MEGMIAAQNSDGISSVDPAQTGSFGVRFGARVIDLVVGMVVGLAGGVVAGVVMALLQAAGRVDDGWLQRIQGGSFLQNMLWGLLAGIVAETVCESVAGTTLGKLLCGYRVVTEDLQPCGFVPALQRSLAYVVDAFFFGVPAYQSMQNSTHNERIGDKWAHTMVVKASALPPRAKRSAGLVALGLLGGLAAQGMVLVGSMIVRAM